MTCLSSILPLLLLLLLLLLLPLQNRSVAIVHALVAVLLGTILMIVDSGMKIGE